MKTSIRFFNDKILRAVYDEVDNKWYSSCIDLVFILTETKNSNVYWSALKSRYPKIKNYIKQFRLRSEDDKYYLTDCIDEKGIKEILKIIKSSKHQEVEKWLDGSSSPLDQQSKQKAYELWNSSILNDIEIGTVKSLQQIHAHIFGGLYDFAGQIRKKDIAKDGYLFATVRYLTQTLIEIENMPESTYEQIINKYVEMSVAHPFMEGNGRSTRIWLDLILKKNLHNVVDWSKIEKKQYLDAMIKSHDDSTDIINLIRTALTDKINNREIFMKGIDYSYYYEDVEM